MKARRTFNAQAELADAKAGGLRGPELRKAIKHAEELGMAAVAKELKMYLVDAVSFAGDTAPQEIKDRISMGMSLIQSITGHYMGRTIPMLRNLGIIGTLNGIGKNSNSSKNFKILCDAGREDLTAEAIILDWPHLFDETAIKVARERLGR